MNDRNSSVVTTFTGNESSKISRQVYNTKETSKVLPFKISSI